MKTAIYYQSFFHGTEMYARWLGEMLGADVRKFNWLSRPDFTGYDRVIAMSAVYAFKLVPVRGFVKRNWKKLKDVKDVVVITCGIAPAEDPVTLKVLQEFPEDIKQKVRFLKLTGAEPFAKGEAQTKNIKRQNVVDLLKQL